MSVSQHFIKAKTIVGYLDIMGELVKEKDLLLYVLRGLESRYNFFMMNIKMKDMRAFINTMQNYFKSFNRMIHKQNDSECDQVYHVNVAKFHKKGYGKYKSQTNKHEATLIPKALSNLCNWASKIVI